MARFWSAPAESRRVGSDGALFWISAFTRSAPRGLIPPEGSTPNNPKRHRATTTPARLPRWGPRLRAAALQTRLLKIKIPSPQHLRESNRLATGSSFRKEISRCGLNTFARAFKSCKSIQAGLLALIIPLRNDLHSGATARESHPLPYSSRFDAGHPNAFERAWNKCSRVAGRNLSRAGREVKNLRKRFLRSVAPRHTRRVRFFGI